MDCGVSASKAPNSSMKIEAEKVSMPSSSKESHVNADRSQESPSSADKPAKNSLDSDLSTMELLAMDSQDNGVPINEILNSSSSNEMDSVFKPSSSNGSDPVNTDNSIDEKSLESDQSTIFVSVNETH
ncbi:hypothetical protein POTOM_008168 [Populus tomentosa]|uniref:Uncharacterized protein n=1 Tax=Populus tomentosa TaxID=118781 RepID=A0A8X8DCB4_POPTO|nr:hypothetical protein POTOM_008168 [Populus tomentosa]